jgi:hypothetical protein
MKKISQFVDSRISCVDDLYEALQLAMQLEFATIPPYLCAQWSIRLDPDRVEGVLHRVVGEEMGHLALIGNVLAAVGGVPQLACEDFVPSYPLEELPGGIPQALSIDLRPLDQIQLSVFMQIEYPQFPPVAFVPRTSPATIGEFYDCIIDGLRSVKPVFKNAHSVPVLGGPEVYDLETAVRAIQRIKGEGEGLEDSPEEPSSSAHVLAHYYAFKEVYVGRKLIFIDGAWAFKGSAIRLPAVYNFADCGVDQAVEHFTAVFSELLIELENCWSIGRPLSMVKMLELKIAGSGLVKSGRRPVFAWVPQSK